MPANLDTNELVLTIVDQAHQIRRLTDLNESLNQMLAQAHARIDQLEKAEEARKVADDIVAEAPRAKPVKEG